MRALAPTSASSSSENGCDLGAGPDLDVAQDAVGADAGAVAQADPALEDAIHVDRHVAPASELAADVDARGIRERHAGFEEARGLVHLVVALEVASSTLLLTPRHLVRRGGLASLTGTPSATAAAITSVR